MEKIELTVQKLYTTVHKLHIYFCKREVSFAKAMRVIRRDKAVGWKLLRIWMVGRISGSTIVHVAIGYRGCVLNPTFSGNGYFPEDVYAQEFPDIQVVFEVPTSVYIKLQQDDDSAKSTLASFVKLFTFGWYRTKDCTCIVRQCLIDSGYKVPRRIISPIGLYRWLIKEGFEYVKFDAQDDVPEWYASKDG